MQGTQRVHFKIQKGNGRRLIVRRLCRGVDDQAGPQFFHQRQHAGAVADIQRLMPVAGDFAAQPVQHPARVALGTEEDRSMVIVNSGDAESLAREENRHLGTDQATRASYQNRWDGHLYKLYSTAPCSMAKILLPVQVAITRSEP